MDSATKKLLKPGFELDPFAFRVALVEKYRAELSLDAFKNEITGKFFLESLSERRIESLYEMCLEARLQKELMAKARGITGRDSWRRSRRKLDKLIKSLRGYQRIDIEKRLRENLSGGASVTLSSTEKLATQLADLTQVCEWWEGSANWDVWGAFYRGHVWGMDRLLHETRKPKVRSEKGTGSKESGKKIVESKEQEPEIIESKERRAAIIAAAIRWMGVESPVSPESIERSLSREARDPRRFVFRGQVIAVEPVDGSDKALVKFLKKWSTKGTPPSPARKTRSGGPRKKSSKRSAGQLS